uniref:CUB domain-containing protein n=1 Tax=Biomphalaria glabrata TaxID=6526 RepID=A0A2C9LFQ0_BIOGL
MAEQLSLTVEGAKANNWNLNLQPFVGIRVRESDPTLPCGCTHGKRYERQPLEKLGAPQLVTIRQLTVQSAKIWQNMSRCCSQPVSDISHYIGHICCIKGFKSRVIDCPGDFLNIYDGIHTRDPLIATLCNGDSTLNITSTTPNLLIYYQNDNYESWGVGFVAYYYIHGQYGDYCNSSDQCPLGFVCNDSRKCDCLNSEKYDPKYKICKNERIFGDTCSNTNLCSNGFVCVNDKCDCSANMYYNTSLKNCISGQYGDYCNNSDKCPLGFVCNDSRKCDCLNSEEYDPKYKICKNGSQDNSQSHH